MQSFSPHPAIQPPRSSPLEPRAPSQEYHERAVAQEPWESSQMERRAESTGLGGEEGREDLGKVFCPGSYCNKVKTAERPGVTFKGSQKRKDSSQRESLVSI